MKNKKTSFIKKASKKANKLAGVIQKKWKASEPDRKKYGAKIGKATKKAGKKGVQILRDVIGVIKKDLKSK